MLAKARAAEAYSHPFPDISPHDVCPAGESCLCHAFIEALRTRPHSELPLPWSPELTLPARRTLCHPNEWYDEIPIICHGWAASALTLPDGRRQILAILLTGDIASTQLLFEPTSNRSVETITDVRYHKFKRSTLMASLSSHPGLLAKLSKAWVNESTQADQLAVDLGRRTADERLARLIVNLTDRLTARDLMQGQTFDFPLRHRHIADATGLTPVHISKTLGKFCRNGLIEINSRSITILNPTELRRIAVMR